MNQNDLLKTAHPSFNVSTCKILWYGKVTAIPLNDERATKDLVVASCGVFVIKNRSFPRTYKVETVIPYHEMKAIIINQLNVSIITKSLNFAFASEQQLSIINKIIETRKVLFDSSLFPISINIDPSVEECFNKFSFSFETNSILADRFSSLVLSSSAQIQAAQVEIVSQNLAQIQKTFRISQKTYSFPYLNAILTAISMEPSITEVEFYKMSTPQIFPTFAPFFKMSHNVTRVSFKDCIFSGSCNSFADFIITDNCPIKEIIMERCDLQSSDFSNFMECFALGKLQLSVFALDDCIFSADSFDQLCQAVYNCASLHSLSVFWLSNNSTSSAMLDVFGRQLFVTGSPANALCLRQGNILIGKSFSCTKKCFPPILDLSGNKMVEFPSDFSSLLCKKQKLVLADCLFEEGTICSLLERLKGFDGELELDLSNATHFEELFNNDIVIPSLVELAFDRNKFNNDTIFKFISFITKQPKLSSLSISDCIDNEDFPKLLLPIASIFSTGLKRLRFASTDKTTALGPSLAQLVGILFEKGIIEDLDISGQELSSENLIELIEKFPKSLKNFAFDRNGVRNETEMSSIICLLLGTNLAKVSWPICDLTSLEVSTTSSLDNLKKRFFDKFEDYVTDNSTIKVIEEYKKKAEEYVKTKDEAKEEQTKAIEDIGMQFWHTDKDIQNILEECGAPDPEKEARKAFESISKFNELSNIVSK